jgi:hypothetical protein
MKRIIIALFLLLTPKAILVAACCSQRASMRDSITQAIDLGQMSTLHRLAMEYTGPQPTRYDVNQLQSLMIEPCQEVIVDDSGIETFKHTSLSQAVQEGNLAIVRYLVEVIGLSIDQKIKVIKTVHDKYGSAHPPSLFQKPREVSLCDIALTNDRKEIYMYLKRKQHDQQEQANRWAHEFVQSKL